MDGHATHVIAVDDLAGLRFGAGMVPQESGFEPRRVTRYVDAAQSVPRRMIIEGRMRREGRTTDMQKQLAEMPEAQRKMVEEMLKSQTGGGMNIELVGRELRVNQGARD